LNLNQKPKEFVGYTDQNSKRYMVMNMGVGGKTPKILLQVYPNTLTTWITKKFGFMRVIWPLDFGNLLCGITSQFRSRNIPGKKKKGVCVEATLLLLRKSV